MLKNAKDNSKRQHQKQSQSPFRQQLLETNLPPKSIRIALSTFRSSGKNGMGADLAILDEKSEDEMTDVKKMQAKTEQLIKQRTQGKTSPVRSIKIKKPKRASPTTVQPFQPDANPQPEDGINSSQELEAEPSEEFDTNKWVMRQEENNAQEVFQQQFYGHLKTDRLKINQRLVELVYTQVEETLNQRYDMGLGDLFQKNINHWATMLVKSKKLQGVLADFNDQIQEVLDYEINHQTKFVKDFLRYPRLKGDPGFYHQVQMPRNPPSTKAQLNVFLKAQKHIKQVEREVKKEEKKKQQLQILEEEKKEKLKETLKAISSKQRGTDGKKLLLPIQETLLERLSVIESKTAMIEENTVELTADVEGAEKDMTDIRGERIGKYPGMAIQHLLQRWEDDDSWFSHADMRKYVNELWLTKAQFEEELREQQSAMKLELIRKESAFVARVDQIRSNTAFQIQALETALLETKIKYRREVERTEMKLAEMESHFLNNQKDQRFIDDTLAVAENLVTAGAKDPIRGKIDPEKEVKVLKENIEKLLQTVTSLKGENKVLAQDKVELQGIIERDKGFNQKQQDDFKRTKELTIYYQMLVHDILKRTKVFERAKVTREDSVLFSEIFQLNEERLRKDAEDAETMVNEDPKRALQRLSNYCDDMHNIFVELDIKKIFDNFIQTVEDKEKMALALSLELADIGLVSQQHLSNKEPAIKIEELVREDDLLVTDKKQDSSFQRFVPKRRSPLELYEKPQWFQPIGLVKPERKLAIHTLLEQLRLPNNERLHMIIEKEEEKKRERDRTMLKQEREAIQNKEEQERLARLEANKMMEAQHHGLSKNIGAKQGNKEKKKIADKIAKVQDQRAIEIEKKARAKEAAEQKAREQGERAAQKAKKKTVNQKGEQNLEEDGDGENEAGSALLKLSGKILSGEEKVAEKSKNNLTLSVPNSPSKLKNKTKTPRDSRTNSRIQIRVQDQLVNPPPMTKQDSIDSDCKTIIIPNPIEDAQNIVEDKVRAKHAEIIDNIKDLTKKDFTFTVKDFDLMFDSFKDSLGKEINARDFNELFESGDVEKFIENSNSIVARYIKPKDNITPRSSEVSVTKAKNTKMLIADLIAPDVDAQGDFQGFKIRTDLAKAWYVEEGKDTNKLAKLVKTNNYLNRMMLEPDYEVKVNKAGKEVGRSIGVECDLMQEKIQIVEKEVIKLVEVPQAVETKTEIPLSEKEELMAKFFKVIRSHCAAILLRETPDQIAYYKMVWKDQKPEELITYSMPDVFEEIPEDGLEEEDRELYPKMTVLDYFTSLLKILNDKLLMNVPRDEKKFLDLKKWIWAGDVLEVPDTKQLQDQSAQTPKEWMKPKTAASKSPSKITESPATHATEEHQRNPPRRISSKNQNLSKFQSPKRPAVITAVKQVQTGDDLLNNYFKAKEAQGAATATLKEQIDQMMSEEILKTIESMQVFMNSVNNTNKMSNDMQKDTGSSQGYGKSDRLKKKLKSLRMNLEDDTNKIKQFESKLGQVAKRESQLVTKKESSYSPGNSRAISIDNEARPSPKHMLKKLVIAKKEAAMSQFNQTLSNKPKSKLPKLTTSPDDLQRNGSYEGQRFSSQARAQQNNPFKQINAQMQTTAGFGRTISGSMHKPNIHHIRLDLSNPSMLNSESTVNDTAKPINFFTGIKRELQKGPVRGELVTNYTPRSFLSPSYQTAFRSQRNSEHRTRLVNNSDLGQPKGNGAFNLNEHSAQNSFMSLTQTGGFKKKSLSIQQHDFSFPIPSILDINIVK